MKRIIQLLTFSCLFSIAFAQDNAALTGFNLIRVQNSIRVRWIVKAGFSCSNVKVERSSDSVHFQEVYSYPGICGAGLYDEGYECPDLEPVWNTKVYYRINLGSYGYSGTKSITLTKYNSQGFSFIPNPTAAVAKILFENEQNNEYELYVYDPTGMRVQHIDHIYGGEVTLDISKLNGGVYLFRLRSNNGRVMQGKFTVAGK